MQGHHHVPTSRHWFSQNMAKCTTELLPALCTPPVGRTATPPLTSTKWMLVWPVSLDVASHKDNIAAEGTTPLHKTSHKQSYFLVVELVLQNSACSFGPSDILFSFKTLGFAVTLSTCSCPSSIKQEPICYSAHLQVPLSPRLNGRYI